MSKTIIFLHGLGETPDAWSRVLNSSELKDYKCIAPALFAPDLLTEEWSLNAATDMLTSFVGEKPVHLVGVSLGAIVALNVTIRYPHLVSSLFLSAPQAKPSPALMRVQSLIMRLLPKPIVCPPGLTKKQLVAVLNSLRTLDLTPCLAAIELPTTVVCGTKDQANLPAAHHIAKAIPHAKLEIIPHAKHQWHTQMPQQFATLVARHISRASLEDEQ